MKTLFFQIGLVALLFGGWPLVARAAGKTGLTGAFIMAVVAVVPITFMMLRQGMNLPAARAFWILVAAGTMMGTGFTMYNLLVSNPQIPVSVIVPTISALMIVVSVVGGICFFREPATLLKIAGVTLVIVGVIFLRPAAQKPTGVAPALEPAVALAGD